MSTAEIRLATAFDLAALPEIERDADMLFLDVLESLGLTRDVLGHTCAMRALVEARQDGRLWVAVSNAAEPVGFAMAVELGGYAHLDELAVRRSHGRQALGSGLLEAVCQWARAAGFPAVTLSTFRHVEWNGPFYHRRGFREVPPSTLSAAHVRLAAAEAQRGLRTDLRVMMAKPLQRDAE